MPHWTGIVGIVGFLILLYLLLRNPSSTEQIFNSLAGGTVGTIGALQGRSVSLPGGVSVSG